MKIVLYTGYQSTKWNPDTQHKIGLGGTEQCVLYLAYHLAAYLGNQVWVVGDVIEGDFDNVKYRTTSTFKNEVDSVDTIIATSYIHYLKEFEDFNYKNSIFWVHNTDYFTYWRGKEIENHRELLNHPKLSHIICLTYWHRDKFVEHFPESYNKIQIIGNGIYKAGFVDVWPKPKQYNGKILPGDPLHHLKIDNQYIYTSHAERGLEHLLEEWPSILERTPDATLKVATPEYGLEYFNLYFKEWVNNLEGVEFVGTLPQRELYQLMASSSYWYYPSDYEETFCITALEMLGHKVQPITWEWGGLKETLQGFNTRNIYESINWNLVKSYLHYKDWKIVVRDNWLPLITKMNMKIDYFYVLTTNETKELQEKCLNVNLPSPTPHWIKPGFNARNPDFPEILEKFGVKKHPRWKFNTPNEWWSRDVMDGELGCSLSHIDAWVEAYAKDHNVTIIFEDDFKEVNQVPWDQVQQLLDMDYDLIYLGRSALKADLEKPIEGVVGWVEPDYSYNAHAYILSKKGLQILVEEYLEQFKGAMFAIDEFLPITYGMTHRQEILGEYNGKTRLKAAAPIVNYYEQENSPGSTFYVRPDKNQPEILQVENWKEWCDKYINPHIRKGQYKLMVDEIASNVIEFPLFTEKFCNEVIELAEQNEWVTDRHTFYPTTDQTMESLGLQSIYQRVLEEFVYPVWIWFWDLQGDTWSKLQSENFIAKYDTLNQGSLDLHHDDSIITLNLRLNNDFKGGGTYLPKYKTTVQPRKIGNVMAHPGVITHLHGGRPVEEGTRYILVTFTKK
jgi:glycosyltransferase involved in cell wall biosynthesis